MLNADDIGGSTSDPPPPKQPSRVRAYVHLKQRFDVRSWRADYDRGLVPDATPYGFHHARDLGFDISFPAYQKRKIFQRLVNRLLGFDLVHAWRNRHAITNADIVWTMTETEFMAVAALPFVCRSMRRPRVIAQTIWMFDRWGSFFPMHRWMARKLLERVDVLTVHTGAYVPVIRSIASEADVRVLPFGISRETFPLSVAAPHGRNAPIRIFAPGTDSTRDWPTLLSAFGNDSRFEVIVVSSALPSRLTNAFSNLQLPRSPTMEEFRNYYRWADFVVVPMTLNRYSGITVALEAATLGTPVVSSETGGVPTYFESGEVLYVRPGDPKAMRDSVLACDDRQRVAMAAAARRRVTDDGYSTREMAARYVRLSLEILGCASGIGTEAAAS